MRCNDCGQLFGETTINEDGVPACPRCGSGNISAGGIPRGEMLCTAPYDCMRGPDECLACEYRGHR